MQILTRFLPTAVCAFALSGCATLQRQAFAELEVEVSEVKLVNFLNGQLDVVLTVHNPNNYRLDASGLRYRVMVDTTEIAAGTVDQRVTLRRRDSAVVRVPVTIGVPQAIAVASQLASRGSLPFKLSGDFRFETALGSVRRGFEQRGHYDGLNVSILSDRE